MEEEEDGRVIGKTMWSACFAFYGGIYKRGVE